MNPVSQHDRAAVWLLVLGCCCAACECAPVSSLPDNASGQPDALAADAAPVPDGQRDAGATDLVVADRVAADAVTADATRADGFTADAASADADAADVVTADALGADVATADATSVDTALSLRVVTFNTGTTSGERHDLPPDDGYGSAESAICDEWYGNGLSWTAVVADASAFFATVAADLVVFQEIFDSNECPGIPPEYRRGFVCESWQPGDPIVVQEVLGPGWQVACNLGLSDKCAAVRRAFGSFRGCAADLCFDGLDGARVDGCGTGSRIGRGTIDLVAGGTLTVVNVHGSSGILQSDQDCRVLQFEQVFVDLGDGQPAANGLRNVIMGDFNTDPARHAGYDESAQRINDFAGPGQPFHFVSAVGEDVPPTYSGLFNIDHVISDALVGDCWIAGLTPEHPPVSNVTFFDHKPVVCDLRAP
jgi:hypothetical protein